MWQTQDAINVQMKELARFSKQLVTTQNCRYKTHQSMLQVLPQGRRESTRSLIPEWRRPNTQPFSRPPSLLRCENVVAIFGQNPIETRDSGCKTHEMSAVTVMFSTMRKGCDKIPAPSGRFLTQKFDVTDCFASKCARVLSGAGSV